MAAPLQLSAVARGAGKSQHETPLHHRSFGPSWAARMCRTRFSCRGLTRSPSWLSTNSPISSTQYVKGFPSSHAGHLCLLRLKNQMYPGGDSKHHWPRLCLNTLRWAKKQGALAGSAHSGWGLSVPGSELPNYNPPPFDGIGANEYIVKPFTQEIITQKLRLLGLDV